MPRQRSTLGEEAFGSIKTLTKLAHASSSVDIDRMDDYPAMYHEISDTQCLSFVHTCPADILFLLAKPTFRSILRGEVFGAGKHIDWHR